MREIIHIVYHDPCWDGATAAVVAAEVFNLNLHRAEVVNVEPYSYKDGFSTEFMSDVLDRHNQGVSQTIYLLDVSFEVKSEVGRRDLTAMVGLANGNTDVVWLDHHASSFEALEATFPFSEPPVNFTPYFSKEKSGALITFDYLTRFYKTPLTEFKPFVETVSDQDTWNFELDHTKAFMTALSKKMKPGLSNARSAMYDFEANKESYTREGEIILQAEKQGFEAASATAFTKSILGLDFTCVAHNSYDSLSRLAEYLYLKAGLPACVVMFKADGVKLSFRSCESIGPIKNVAALLSGGGHDYAAGAFITYAKFSELFGE